ncbi:methyl-accepting chemotaxis protein [Bremerella sp. JC770]|uniref:methyl-accepting chemotaxis protein n=1 Tax=Bremerella sp. JC770 TaxID=3232137 RepID=UPI0034599976
MRTSTIQTKFTLWAGVCLLTTMTIVCGYSTIKIRSTAAKTAEEQVRGVALEQSFRVQGDVDETISLVRSLAQTFTSVKDEDVELDLDRESAAGILKIIVKENPQIVGLFTCWEPDEFDQMDAAYEGVEGHDDTGRFLPLVHRGEDGTLMVDALTGYDEAAQVGDYYHAAREGRREIVTSPYWAKNGTDRLLVARVVVPIVVGEQFYGVVGADIRLDSLQQTVEQLDLYNGSGRSMIVSGDGVIVADSRQPERRGTLVESTDKLANIDQQQAICDYFDHQLEAVQPVTLGDSATTWGVVVSVPTAQTQAAANGLMFWQIVIGGISSMIGMGVLWLVAGRVSHPIRQAVNLLRDIAEGDGDLTKKLVVKSNDELGELAEYFNRFADKVRAIVTQIAENATTLTRSSDSLTQTATELASGAADSTTQSAAVAAASEEMSVNINRMATQTEEMTQRIRKMAEAAAEMSESNGEVVRNAGQAASIASDATKTADEGNQRISHLDSLAESIGKVTITIQDIAEQTNLLALNATIEAARAGEAGKGFAVVATEVKALARQTAEATEDIRARIEEIQSSTGHAVRAIRNMADAITNVNQFSQLIATSMDKQSSTIEGVASNVTETATSAEAISMGLTESATASREIAQNITRVDQQSKQTAGSADQAKAAGRDLSGLATTLHTLVNQFKY